MSAPTKEALQEAINDLLSADVDLASLSSKKVRKQLEYKFGAELSARKREIDGMLMKRVEEIEKAKRAQDSDSDDKKTAANGNGSSAPPAKKARVSVKCEEEDASTSKTNNNNNNNDNGISSDSDLSDRNSPNEPNDEELAKRLQREELGTRSRGATRNKPEKKPKAKSAARKGTSIYSEECFLSTELADLMGTEKMARSDVVKNMWRIIKERELQDPKNKQFVICDEQMLKIFKVKKFKAFGMMKTLKNHITDPRQMKNEMQ